MRMKKKGEKNGMMIFAVIAVIAVLFYGGNQGWFKGTGGSSVETVATSTGASVPAGCNQNPSATYSAVDYFTQSTVARGTDQIKQNGDAPVSTLSTPTVGTQLTYWLSNSSLFCEPVTKTTPCGSFSIQAKCLGNYSATMSVYDEDNKATLGAGGAGTNVTIGANSAGHLTYSYTTTGKKSEMALGGCMIIEYPSSLSQVQVSGEGISSDAVCQYATSSYTVSSTSNTYIALAVPKMWDAGTTSVKKNIALTLISGASDPSGTVKVAFMPAQYYVTNDGNFDLNTQKVKNADTTRTTTDLPSTTFIVV